MSEIIRIIALAIVTFLVTIIVIILSNPDLSRMAAGLVGIDLTQEEPDSGRTVVALEPGDTVFPVQRPDKDKWIGLIGFPSNAEIRFPVPRDLPVTRGQLRLVLYTQMIETGDGLMTVAINGTQRDALVLESGTHTVELLYDLTLSEMAGGDVTVALSGNGTTNYGQICPTNVTNLGAAIELARTSALLLELASPFTSDEAELAALSGELGIDWTGVAAPAWAAQYMSRMAVPAKPAAAESADMVLVATQPEPLTHGEDGAFLVAMIGGIEHVTAIRGGSLPSVYHQSWPVDVRAVGADVRGNTFRGSRRWDLNYRLADMPEGIAPDVLNLELATSTLAEPYDWVVRVLLNDRLIYSRNHDGRQDRIAEAIPLPADAQGLNNHIVVVLTDPSPNQGICRAGPEAAAQMLETTTLGYDDPTPANAREALVRALAGAGEIVLTGAGELTQAHVVQASGLLGLVLPLTTPVRFDAAEATHSVTIVDQAGLEALTMSNRAGEENAYLVYPGDPTDPARIEVEPLGAGKLPDLGVNGSALVVQW